jgi:hypothetical protein
MCFKCVTPRENHRLKVFEGEVLKNVIISIQERRSQKMTKNNAMKKTTICILLFVSSIYATTCLSLKLPFSCHTYIAILMLVECSLVCSVV